MDSTDTTNRSVFEQAILDGMVRAGVPKRYLSAEASHVIPGFSAYITGSVGSGKTHEACGLLRQYLVSGATSAGNGTLWFTPKAHFTTAAHYLAEVKRGFDGDSRAATYRRTPLLVLDDLGQEVPTQWAVAELFELVNHRYSEQLPTIYTSQFSRGDIARRLAKNGGDEQALAIASRIAESCTLIHLGKTDRRLK